MSVYLEPDFKVLTPLRAFTVPWQLRSPHPCVTAFTGKRQYVSRPQIGRAALFLQGWSWPRPRWAGRSPAKTPAGYGGRGEASLDLAVRLPSREVTVTIRELDQRGRPGLAFVTRTDYYTRTERTTANSSFAASGRLEVTVFEDVRHPARPDPTRYQKRHLGGATARPHPDPGDRRSRSSVGTERRRTPRRHPHGPLGGSQDRSACAVPELAHSSELAFSLLVRPLSDTR